MRVVSCKQSLPGALLQAILILPVSVVNSKIFIAILLLLSWKKKKKKKLARVALLCSVIFRTPPLFPSKSYHLLQQLRPLAVNYFQLSPSHFAIFCLTLQRETAALLGSSAQFRVDSKALLLVMSEPIYSPHSDLHHLKVTRQYAPAAAINIETATGET